MMYTKLKNFMPIDCDVLFVWNKEGWNALKNDYPNIKSWIDFPKSLATACNFRDSNGDMLLQIVTINFARMPKNKWFAHHVAGLAAHEANHIVQNFWEEMGEDEPGQEVTSYAIQWITQGIMEACKENKLCVF